MRYDSQNDVRCLRIILREELGRLSCQSLYLSAGLLSESCGQTLFEDCEAIVQKNRLNVKVWDWINASVPAQYKSKVCYPDRGV